MYRGSRKKESSTHVIKLCERALVPDGVIRWGIRILVLAVGGARLASCWPSIPEWESTGALELSDEGEVERVLDLRTALGGQGLTGTAC